MPVGDDPGALPPELRGHANALRRVQTPGAARRRANWAAVERRIDARPRATRTGAIAIGLATAALAAGLALWWGRGTPTLMPADRERASAASQERAPTPVTAPVQLRTHVQPPPTVPEEHEAPSVPDESPALERPTQSRAEVRRPAPPPPPPTKTSTLTEEIAAFARVREAVAARRFEEGLAGLRAYRTAHPQGAFAAEADVTEVEILCRMGRRDEALTRQARFLREQPGSHLAPRVREACR